MFLQHWFDWVAHSAAVSGCHLAAESAAESAFELVVVSVVRPVNQMVLRSAVSVWFKTGVVSY